MLVSKDNNENIFMTLFLFFFFFLLFYFNESPYQSMDAKNIFLTEVLLNYSLFH